MSVAFEVDGGLTIADHAAVTSARAFLCTLMLQSLACGDTESADGVGGAGGSTNTTSSTSSSTTDGGAPNTGGSSADGGGVPVGCYDYASFSPTTVSFSDDVMPLFAARCASCHMDTNGTYYGSDAALVYDKLLNAVPVQAPGLRFVEPNDPLHSYMLAKVEYENPGATCSEVQCTVPGCELFAPPGGMLSESEKATLRSWIMTGAAND